MATKQAASTPTSTRSPRLFSPYECGGEIHRLGRWRVRCDGAAQRSALHRFDAWFTVQAKCGIANNGRHALRHADVAVRPVQNSVFAAETFKLSPKGCRRPLDVEQLGNDVQRRPVAIRRRRAVYREHSCQSLRNVRARTGVGRFKFRSRGVDSEASVSCVCNS